MILGESIPVISDVFHWTYIINAGAAFGMLENSRIFFVSTAFLVVVAAIYLRKHILAENLYIRLGSGLFIGGTIGNMWDRIVSGGVTDFFDFRIWPVFNVADIAICVGAALVVLGVALSDNAGDNAEE